MTEYTDLALDEENDLDFVWLDDTNQNTDVPQISGADEVEQSLTLLLQTWQGEFFADKEMGIDAEEVFGKNADESLLQSLLANALEQDERVSRVEVTSVEDAGENDDDDDTDTDSDDEDDDDEEFYNERSIEVAFEVTLVSDSDEEEAEEESLEMEATLNA